jgi:hypothetical protein
MFLLTSLLSLRFVVGADPIVLLEPFRPLCSQDSISPMLMSAKDTSYGSYIVQFSIPIESEYATRTIGLFSDNRNQDPYYLQLNFNRGRQDKVWAYNDETKQFEQIKGTPAEKYIILNMRSEKGMSNLKIAHEYNLASDFTGQYSLGILWQKEKVTIKRIGTEPEEIIFDSDKQDLLYQSTMTEVDFNLYDSRAIEYPAPFKVTISALPSLMKFLFIVFQNRKGETGMANSELRIASYEYIPQEGLAEQTNIKDPFDNIKGWTAVELGQTSTYWLFERVFSVILPSLITPLAFPNGAKTDNWQVLTMRPFQVGILSQDATKYVAKTSTEYSTKSTFESTDEIVEVNLTF